MTPTVNGWEKRRDVPTGEGEKEYFPRISI